MAIRVFACDDDPVFAQLLGFWFEDHPDLELVGAGHDRESCLSQLRDLRPDVVLLDSMHRADRPLSVDDVRAAAPGARVIVVSGHPPEVVRRFVEGDADGYVQKASDDHALVAALSHLSAR